MERFNGTPNTRFIVNLSGRPTLDGTVSVIDLPRRKLLGKIKTPRPRQTSGRETLASLLQDADVFVQGYRPGAIAGFGFDPSGLPRPNDGNRRRAVFGIMRQVDGGGPDPSAIARVVGLNRAAADRFWNEGPFARNGGFRGMRRSRGGCLGIDPRCRPTRDAQHGRMSARGHFPGRQHAGLAQFQRIPGIRAREWPTETVRGSQRPDCVAGVVDGVSGLVAAVSGPLGGCASD
jgi:hypothetical protein